ncbi:PREDICTED: LOC109950269 [Prunus dulcis]|uniref:PREDICTED: LOC109950269 n=1 Tax=Prunus dulcis TaxID=3755 RepID=A0A5E4E4D4_PRUDU|nr:uncharacterized protein LOC117635571 [Prunus dulcis]KAI5320049.1 hypothetical protein L3X38_039757 [Prunus dulcis]VVA10196.1 PREDICTED: LOC109950269 [Prunus dulcis]
MASTRQRDLKYDYRNIRRLYEMEKLMKAQVDGTADASNKQMLQSALIGIGKMRKDLWQGFNNSLKVTLESKSIRAFRVQEALKTPQEWDVMDILVQYLCDDTSDSAAADPYSASYAGENRNPSAPEHLVQYLLADTSDSAAADPYSASYAEENRNPSAPEQNSCDELWSWILARGTTVGKFAATVAELWLLTKVSEFFSKTAVPQIDTHIVNPTSSPKTKLPFATVVAQKGLQQILDAVKLDA